MSKIEEKINKSRLRSSAITTVVSIALVLYMLGMLGVIILHAERLSNYVRENIGFTLYIKAQVKEANILRFKKQLDITPFVKSSKYITREEAASRLTADLGEDFIDFLGVNPLPASIELRLNAGYTHEDSLVKIEQLLSANPHVAEINYQKTLVHQINQNLKKISYVMLGFSALLLLIAIVLINNTIRLSVYAKRFIIRTMQLVGATQGFIRRPFIFTGIIHGLYGGIIAVLLLAGTLYFARDQIPEIIFLQEINLLLIIFGLVIFTGVLLSWISTYLAVRKYLRIKTDSLYL